MTESPPGRIFISYRRQETAWPARQLYDVMVERFGAEQVFKDVDNIEPGDDFVERITSAVGSCDVLLALIGPRWLTITDDETGQRRLDNPDDYVRLEIQTALDRHIRVIPILIDDARMPRPNELPPNLAPLVRRHAVEISPITFDTKATDDDCAGHAGRVAPRAGRRTSSHRRDAEAGPRAAARAGAAAAAVSLAVTNHRRCRCRCCVGRRAGRRHPQPGDTGRRHGNDEQHAVCKHITDHYAHAFAHHDDSRRRAGRSGAPRGVGGIPG
ncbi:MAG TPA: toll/interleukin-1 receptor domain-containing protein [Jiangellaceae bacterium]